MIEVDAKKCTGCGFCSDECPAGIFVVSPAPDGSRMAQVRYLSRCTGCGHCVAICPQDAIVHGELPVDKFEGRPNVVIGPDAMRAFLLSRRSIRAFKEKPVPGDLIEQLIEVGTHAGTASNAQTENFIVIQDRRLLAELEDMVIGILWDKLKLLGSGIGQRLARIRYGEETVRQSMLYHERFKAARDSGDSGGLIFRNAPVVIAVHGQRTNRSVHENCAIATRNMEMIAMSLGLGTCWAGFLLVAAGLTKKIARRLGVSDDRNVYSAIMLGYPTHVYRKTVPRRQREVRWF
ncbi:MAG: nitroreductase family protein [Syntrophorhabdales bacterium]|jgi:nitroreductase/ferredoxin